MPDVTGITALDVAIGLAFVYLLFSVLCSALQEAIAGLLDLRATTLEAGLKNLLKDDGEVGGGAPRRVATDSDPTPGSCELFDKLISHGLVRTLYRDKTWWSLKKKRRGPSYIPSKTFALALLDIVERDTDATVPADSTLTTRITTAQVPAGTRNALLALAKDAQDRDELRKRIEEWFDAGMARVSGWYKRKAQIIICAIAVAVTIVFNVNSIALGDRLIRDDVVRAAVVADATKATLKPGESLGPTLEQIAKTRELGLPIGWNKKAGDPAKVDLTSSRTWFGWFITIAMLSLGAPFWFGALSRLTSLRGAGAKPEPAKA
jgi:hypothetical protein